MYHLLLKLEQPEGFPTPNGAPPGSPEFRRRLRRGCSERKGGLGDMQRVEAYKDLLASDLLHRWD